MTEEGSIQDNMAKGRGIVDKKPFKVIGLDAEDRSTGGHQEESRGPGRPRQDKNWTQVGQDAESENG